MWYIVWHGLTWPCSYVSSFGAVVAGVGQGCFLQLGMSLCMLMENEGWGECLMCVVMYK